MIDIVLMKENKDIIEFGKKLNFSDIYFLNEKDICKSVKEIQKKKGLVIVEGGSEELNRKALESKKVDVLINPESEGKDSIKQRISGLNQVLCKLANKNNILVGFTLDRINNPDIIGRIMQNIRLCRKYKVKMVFFTFAKDKYEMRQANDLISLLKILGMTPLEAKNSLMNLKEKL